MVLTSALILVIIIAIACAGCTSPNTQGTAQSSSGSGSTGSSAAGGATAPAAAGGNCPTVSATNAWGGKWDSYANVDRCMDERQRFYPPSKDYEDPWNHPSRGAGNMHVPVTFTQTGCDVTGTMSNGPDGTLVAPYDCPIKLTGKVDKDNVLSGTWKAYCDIKWGGTENAKDTGVFTLWMEPDGAGFAGTIQGNDPGINKMIAENCPGANGNWVGKRA